jgi:hypothetical protein
MYRSSERSLLRRPRVPVPARRAGRCRGEKVGYVRSVAPRTQRSGPVRTDPTVSPDRESGDLDVHPARSREGNVGPTRASVRCLPSGLGLRAHPARHRAVPEPVASHNLAATGMMPPMDGGATPFGTGPNDMIGGCQARRRLPAEPADKRSVPNFSRAETSFLFFRRGPDDCLPIGVN